MGYVDMTSLLRMSKKVDDELARYYAYIVTGRSRFFRRLGPHIYTSCSSLIFSRRAAEPVFSIRPTTACCLLWMLRLQQEGNFCLVSP